MSNPVSRSGGRVAIDASLHDLYKELTEGKDIEKAPFLTMKDVFMLAVCLGYRRGQRKPIAGKQQQIFHWAQFSDQVDMPILKAIAIAVTGDVLVLSDFGKVVELAEEYANAGIHEVRTKVADYSGEPLWGLVDLVRG